MKLKSKKAMILLSVLLVAVLCGPVAFSHAESNYMVGEVETFAVEADAFQASMEEHYNLWEQIQIASYPTVVWESPLAEYSDTSYMMQETDAVFTEPDSDLQSRAETQLIQKMEEQLQQIQEMGGLPLLSFDKFPKANISKVTYMRVAEKKYAEVLDVWNMDVAYEDFTVSAYMDSRSYALYDIMLISHHGNFEYPSDISSEGYWRYLDSITPVEEMKEVQNETFFVSDSYGKGEVHLYLCSEDETNGLGSYYCFHMEAYGNSVMGVDGEDSPKKK